MKTIYHYRVTYMKNKLHMEMEFLTKTEAEAFVTRKLKRGQSPVLHEGNFTVEETRV